MNVWLVRAGKHGEGEETALGQKIVTIGWNEVPDLSNVRTQQAMAALYRSLHPEASVRKVANALGQLWSFRSRIRPGDLVVLPLKTQSKIAIGKVVGKYDYRKDLGDGVRHFRRVAWLQTNLPRSTFDQDVLHSFGAFMTVCQISRNNAAERIQKIIRRKARSGKHAARTRIAVKPRTSDD